MRAGRVLPSLALALGLTLGIVWLLGRSSPPAHAQGPDGHGVYYVALSCTGVPTPCHTTVQAAVDAADDPDDVIKVSAGTYTGVNVRPRQDVTTTGVVTQVVYISKTLIIQGGYTTTNWSTPDPEVNPTTLDAQRQGRVLYITGDISPTIEGLCITGGDGNGLGGAPPGYDMGGGAYVITATATISSNLIFSNTSGYGGGLSLSSNAAIVSGNVITNNGAGAGGGGLILYDSSATLSGNTVVSNRAGDGGGVGLYYSSDTLTANTICSNTAEWWGGGVSLVSSPARLRGNVVCHNTANHSGGGVYVRNSQAALSGNVVSDNTAGSDGGGLYLFVDGPVTLDRDTVISNTAEKGGGFLLYRVDALMTNTIIAGNHVSSVGGGVYISESTAYLSHPTIAGNTGGDASGVFVTGSYLGWSTLELTNTIVARHGVGIKIASGNTLMVNGVLWSGTPITISRESGTTVMVQNEHEGDPAFVNPNMGDYHICATSAALDRGVNSGVDDDIDDEARPNGAACDIGADEFYFGYTVRLPVVLRDH